MVLYEQRLSDDLQKIRVKVQDISDRVCAALESAVAAIVADDRDALHQVVMNDYGINRDIRCIDKRCHAFVARHLPAAGHLRFISAVLRITIALERAGDYAVTISRVVLQLSTPLPKKLIERLQPMTALSVKMLGGATQAFLAGDAEAIGATRWQIIRKVVLPNSVSGILTGIIIEVSRTAEETAPIMFTGAAFFLPFLPNSLMDETMALSLHLFVISTQVPNVPEHLPFTVALTLIIIVLAMNALSIGFRVWLRGRKKW